MILTVSTSHAPATDLGFLLHKHPDRLQSFTLSVGTAHVVYPEAGPDRTTVALLLEVDPVGLVRRAKGSPEGFALAQYVNDRPYAASSLMSVALTKVFRSAMSGRCDARPELAAAAIPLEIGVPALPCRGGAELARSAVRAARLGGRGRAGAARPGPGLGRFRVRGPAADRDGAAQ